MKAALRKFGREPLARAIAHELGHGAYGLEHEGSAAGGSTTDNLMDYGGGTALTRAQWDAMHSEYRRLTWFQGAEEVKDVIILHLKKMVDGLKAGKASAERKLAYNENDFSTLIQDASNRVAKTYEPVKFDDGSTINLAVEFEAKSGVVDLSVSDEGAYSSVGISVDLKEKFHTQFSVRFYNKEKKLLFKIWATSYDDFSAFLTYIGWSLTPESKAKVVELYKNATAQAKDDPDKLDVIFETIPPYVLEKFNDHEKWIFIRLLNGHSKGKAGTDEYRAIVNLLGSLSPQGLFTTEKSDVAILEDAVKSCPDRLFSSLLYAFSSAGSHIWSDEKLSTTGYTYTYIPEMVGSLPENVGTGLSKWYELHGGAGSPTGTGSSSVYEIGVDAVGYDSNKMPTGESLEVIRGKYAFYDPILVNVTDQYSIMLPAFAAYRLVKNAIGKERDELLNLAISVLLPEINLKAFRALGKVFREGKVENSSSIIFESARDFVRTRYGQNVLNQLAAKFGKTNEGAAAVIVQKWGDEGLSILNKTSVNTFDDVVDELLKGKTAYRHIGSSAGYLKDIKLHGVISEKYGKEFTYFSLDKIDNATEAIDQMQLNGNFNDAVWRAEFDATQLIGKSSFPKGKWSNAEYVEVLTKSYRSFGSGGASQFITQSQIKLKRLVNLNTGEVIKFK